MLQSLYLRDFVLVPQLQLDLHAGFTVLSGETGAGKSILLDALQLVLGERGDADHIRAACPRAEIALECLPSAAAHAWLVEQGLLAADAPTTEPLILRRTLERVSDKNANPSKAQILSRAWINGSPVTLTQLRALAEHIVAIHGQHAWQNLTKPSSARALLDAHAGIDTGPLLALWHTWQTAQAAQRQALAAASEREDQRVRLQWQVDEVAKLGPGQDEWPQLSLEHQRLSHAQTLISAAQSALLSLNGAADARDSDAASACTLVQQALTLLDTHSRIDPQFVPFVQSLTEAEALLADTAHALQNYVHKTHGDDGALAELDARMAHWINLARRLRVKPEELASAWQDWQIQIDRLTASSDPEILAAAERQARLAWHAEAKRIHALRKASAQPLAEQVSLAMQDLGMPGSRLQIALEPMREPQALGLEHVEFQVAGHAGVAPKALSKVASGGELSRIALALAVCTSASNSVPSLIFDEVDAGIGGTTAHTLGKLLQRLGQSRQVLAITHLAQVAACADSHFFVAKSTQQGQTTSQVRRLEPQERGPELARMLGGVSPTSLAHATELLQAAQAARPTHFELAPSA